MRYSGRSAARAAGIDGVCGAYPPAAQPARSHRQAARVARRSEEVIRWAGIMMNARRVGGLRVRPWPLGCQGRGLVPGGRNAAEAPGACRYPVGVRLGSERTMQTTSGGSAMTLRDGCRSVLPAAASLALLLAATPTLAGKDSGLAPAPGAKVIQRTVRPLEAYWIPL